MSTPVYGEVPSLTGAGAAGPYPLGPFCASNTSNGAPGLGGFAGYQYGTVGAGSLLAATLSIASGQNGTATIAIIKNGSTLVTPFTSVSFLSTGVPKYYTATYTAGTYVFAAGDNLGFSVTTQSIAFTMTAYLFLSNY